MSFDVLQWLDAARSVHDKTGANPFFMIRFLRALADEDLLAFDHDARQ
ncbi:hypothetical protein [Cupriavidus oxalaticus]